MEFTLLLQNAKIFISFPHFYNGDESLLENFKGLKPNDKIHESHIDLNSKFGFPMNASLKFQLNMQIKNHQKEIFLPVCWFEVVLPKVAPVFMSYFNTSTFTINMLFMLLGFVFIGLIVFGMVKFGIEMRDYRIKKAIEAVVNR